MVLALSGTRADAQAPGDEAALQSSGREPARQRLPAVLRGAAGVVLFVLVAVAVARSWSDVRETVGRIAPYELLASEALVLFGLLLSALTWRIAMRELDSSVHVAAASKIYLLGQLGKYLPGSLWAVAAQTALAKRSGVPPSRGASAGIVAIGINIVTGFTLGALLVPSLLSGGVWRSLLVVAVVALCAVALSPVVLTRLVNAGLRLVRSPLLERQVSWRGMLSASGLSFTSWLSYGLSVWVLAVGVGATPLEALPLCLGGVALAMTLGVLVVIVPSGIGVREAIIVGALSPVLSSSDALAVALVARLVFTLADLLAALAVLPIRIERPTPAPR